MIIEDRETLKKRQESPVNYSQEEYRRELGKFPKARKFLAKDWLKEEESMAKFSRTGPLTRESVGTGLKFLNDILSQEAVSAVSTSSINKLWRAKILLNRSKGKAKAAKEMTLRKAERESTVYKSPVTNPPTDTKNSKTETLGSKLTSTSLDDPKAVNSQEDTRLKRNAVLIKSKKEESEARLSKRKEANNQIVVYNLGKKVTAITLQTRPNELKVNPASSWASVKSMGRNNPFMMYTGGEDTITLEVSWYSADKDHREDVLSKCRLLESWTRADGYSAPPPILKIRWGTSNIFSRDTFILESAQYTLNTFQDTIRDPKDPKSVKNLGLLPQYATQTLVFKRVSSFNRGRNQIVSLKQLEGITGINLNYSPTSSVKL